MGKKNATAHSAKIEAVATVKSSEPPVAAAAADVAAAAETKPASEGDAVEPASTAPETTARVMVVWGHVRKCYNFVNNQLGELSPPSSQRQGVPQRQGGSLSHFRPPFPPSPTGIDLRSLALFRMALGIVVMMDVV